MGDTVGIDPMDAYNLAVKNERLELNEEDHLERLALSEAKARDLVGQVASAEAEERKRLAYEIHDGFTQTAIATHQAIQTFAQLYGKPPGYTDWPQAVRRDYDRHLQSMADLAMQTIRDSRNVIDGLRPIVLDEEGLQAATRVLTKNLVGLGYIVHLKIQNPPRTETQRAHPVTESHLYRVLQEAVANIQKHSGATEISIKLRLVSVDSAWPAAMLEITDNGCGFDAKTKLENTQGGQPGERIGLSAMRERVIMLGGSFTIYSRRGEGTTVKAEVPMVPTQTDTQDMLRRHEDNDEEEIAS
jgi:signal transduction histidine kinase